VKHSVMDRIIDTIEAIAALFVGLVAAGMLPRVLPVMERRVAAVRVAGAALLLATGGLVLLG